MIPVFPDFIFVDDDGIERTSLSNVVRSEMEVGPQKTRPIQSVGFYNLTMNVSICDEDLGNFLNWFRSELKYGSNWFLMNDPLDGVQRRFRFLTYEITWRKRGSLLTSSFELEAYDV